MEDERKRERYGGGKGVRKGCRKIVEKMWFIGLV